MRKLRAVVVGVGTMGRNHVRVLRSTDGVELVGVADIDAARVADLGREIGLPAFSSSEGALVARPDFAVVAVPTSAHAHAALPLIDAGVHVLVEKPIAATLADAESMRSIAERRGVHLAVGHVERFNPAAAELVRRVQGGEIGRIFHVHTRRIGPFPPRVADVGVVIDLATHDIDLCGVLCAGQPVRVMARARRLRESRHEDLASALLSFEDGTVCSIDVNWLTPTKVREMTVTGERGMLRANLLDQELSHSRSFGLGFGERVEVPVRRAEPLRLEIEDFVECVRGRGEPAVPASSGTDTLRVALRILDAAADDVGQGLTSARVASAA